MKKLIALLLLTAPYAFGQSTYITNPATNPVNMILRDTSGDPVFASFQKPRRQRMESESEWMTVANGGSVYIMNGAVAASNKPGPVNVILRDESGNYVDASSGGGGGAWGSITGTLSAQTDLQSALDAKAATTVVNDTAYNATSWNGDTTHAPSKNAVRDEIEALTVGSGTAWGGITGTLSAQTDLNTALGLKAPLASPALTGTPTAPTATGGTSTTQIATTAFVTTGLAAKQDTLSLGGNLLTGDGDDSGIDPADVITTGNIGSIDAQTFALSVLNFTDVDIATVLSGSTYTLVPGTSYYGTVTGNKTFAFSPSPTAGDPPTTLRVNVSGTGTWTVPTLIREGATGSTTTVTVGSTGYFTATFLKTGAGNLRLIDTIPTALVTSDLPADARVKAVVAEFDGGGSALTTGNTGIPVTVKYAGTIIGYSISADTGTCTAKVWKKAAGTAIPTISDVINTSGVALSSGTSTGVVTTVSDFTTTTVTSGDMITVALTAVSSATKVIVTLYVQI